MSDADLKENPPQNNRPVERTGGMDDIDAYLNGKATAPSTQLNTLDVVPVVNPAQVSRPAGTIGDINAQMRPVPGDATKVTLPGLTVENRDDKPGDRITVDINSPEARNYLAYQKAVVAIKGVESGSTGSGFFVDDKGLLITESHVAKKGDTILVTMSDGKTYSANIAMVYQQSDLAALQLVLPKDVKTQPVALPTKPIQLTEGAPLATLGHPNYNREVHISPGQFVKSEPLSDEKVKGGYLPNENADRTVYQTMMDTRPASSGSLVISLSTGEAVGVQSMSNEGGRTIVTPIADVAALVAAVKASRGEGVNITLVPPRTGLDLLRQGGTTTSTPLPKPAADGNIKFDIRSRIDLGGNGTNPFFIAKPN